MAEGRKDKRGRSLKTGETQRSDGRYCFRFTDENGKRHSVYALELNELRKKEQEIQKYLQMHIRYWEGTITLAEQLDLFLKQKINVKDSTLREYACDIAFLKRYPITQRAIGTITKLDCKQYFIDLSIAGYAYHTIGRFKILIYSALQLAVDDNILIQNPCDFKLRSIIPDNTKKRKALTKEQVQELLNFIKDDKTGSRYYDDFIVLLNTGLRISEYCGLRIVDLDFEKKLIRVDHQLQYMPDKKRLCVDTPKTENGIRELSMTEDVYLALKRIVKRRMELKAKNMMIDGYIGFIRISGSGRPLVGDDFRQAFLRIKNKFNKIAKNPIEDLTPHILRHTFCTHCVASGISVKSLQYIMGHANVSTTLGVYTDFDLSTIHREMQEFTCISQVY